MFGLDDGSEQIDHRGNLAGIEAIHQFVGVLLVGP
jgi:hypothetical protein